jgi:hypothetical protein
MSSTDNILIQALNGTIRPIMEIQKLLSMNCKIESVHPAMLASDSEVNIVTVTVICPEGAAHTIRAYREEASALREYVRLLKLKE